MGLLKLCGRYRQILEEAFLSIAPYSQKELRCRMAALLKWVGIVSATVSLSLFVMNLWLEGEVTCTSVITSLFPMTILLVEIPSRVFSRERGKLRKDMLVLIYETARNISFMGNVSESLLKAGENKSPEILLNVNEINGILTRRNRKENVRKYINNPLKDIYMKMFLMELFEVTEYGDTGFSRKSENIRSEIIRSLIKEKEKMFTFSGYLFVTVVPVVFYALIKRMGCSFSEEMNVFYQKGGKLVILVAFLITVGLTYLCELIREHSLINGKLHRKTRLEKVISFVSGNDEYCEEVKLLEAVITAECDMPGLSTFALLEDLELFSFYFKPLFRECLNTYSQGSLKALKTLKSEGTQKYEGFRNIADGFLFIDDVGIEEAFAGIENNVFFLDRMNELDNNIKTNKKRGFLDIVSWIPGIIMIGGYFLIPFLRLTLSQMEELFSQIIKM